MSKEMSDFIPDTGSILYIDVGNTSIKAAYRSKSQWVNPRKTGFKNISSLREWIKMRKEKFDHIVLVSVLPEVDKVITDEFKAEDNTIITHEDIPRHLLSYNTPATLGLDRFFACYGAVAVSDMGCVVIDAGTACTVDFMTSEYVYCGGVIMPGVGILENAFQKGTPNLPDVDRVVPDSWPGSSTETSIQWGISGLIKEGLNAYLDKYERSFGNYRLIITGGDAQWVDTLVYRKAEVHPMVIFEGMRIFSEDIL